MLNQPGLRALNLQKGKLLDRVANVNPELASQIRNLKLEWYAIRNAAEGINEDSTDVFIYDEIGGSFGVDASMFVQELNEITTPEIVVRINSPGGALMDGIAIANAFQQHSSHIITRVDSMAASAASIIAVSGDSVEMMPGSQMMIHDALINAQANPAELENLLEWLHNQSDNVADFYARKAGGTRADWRARMQAETWMFADEALELKLADQMYSSPKRQQETEPAAVNSVDAALQTLMNRKHRLTNRGYKYLGREKAPTPAALVTLANAVRHESDEAVAALEALPLATLDNAPISQDEINEFLSKLGR
jgi:ATP-dependent protease ClpP protease subunit